MDTIAHSQQRWQLPLDSLPDQWWDVLIIGAGPAGSMAAIHLASQGYQVLLVDKHPFPRDKICGDALIPDAIKCFQRAGLYERVCGVGYRVNIGTIFSPSQIEVNVPGEFLTVKRLILDELIAREAVARGATLGHGQVKDLSIGPDGTITASVSACPRPCRARIAVIATGADVSLLQPLDMVVRPHASAIAMRCYIRSSFYEPRLVISFDRSIIPGYAWIFPVGNNEYNVGCGIAYRDQPKDYPNLRGIFQQFITKFPLARQLVQHGETITPLQGARLRSGLTGAHPFRRGNILAIGETIGATFPFTGEGIGKAMETGELAASVIHAAFTEENFERLSEFPRQLEQELRPRYFGYQVAENWLSKAWLNDLVMRRAQNSTFLRDALTGVLAETIDPRTIFSVWGILKSFWM